MWTDLAPFPYTSLKSAHLPTQQARQLTNGHVEWSRRTSLRSGLS